MRILLKDSLDACVCSLHLGSACYFVPKHDDCFHFYMYTVVIYTDKSGVWSSGDIIPRHHIYIYIHTRLGACTPRVFGIKEFGCFECCGDLLK